jgi:hypothetical protein
VLPNSLPSSNKCAATVPIRSPYFEWVFEKLMHNPPEDQLGTLLPAEWIKTRPTALQTAQARIA